MERNQKAKKLPDSFPHNENQNSEKTKIDIRLLKFNKHGRSKYTEAFSAALRINVYSGLL